MDIDEGYSEPEIGSTLSLVPSIVDYIHKNGQTYCVYKFGDTCIYPDEDELNRLDLMDCLITTALNGQLHRAPIESNPQRILDLGCGTGKWCIDMGDLYPSAEVIGIDLSPCQPIMVPPNVCFELDDVEDDWTFSFQFDYIHARYMVETICDWSKFVNQCYEHCRSGGWVEFQDMSHYGSTSNMCKPQSRNLLKWLDGCHKTSKWESAMLNPGSFLINRMHEAGFVNIRIERKLLPLRSLIEGSSLTRDGHLELEGRLGADRNHFANSLSRCGHEPEDFQDLDANTPIEFHLVYGQKR